MGGGGGGSEQTLETTSKVRSVSGMPKLIIPLLLYFSYFVHIQDYTHQQHIG